MVEALQGGARSRRADLSCGRTPIKRFTAKPLIQPLEVEKRLTTLVSKALEIRAFQTVGDAKSGRQRSE
jgi:hypothetical protein